MRVLEIALLLLGVQDTTGSFIDRHIEARLEDRPAPPCGESEFLRRVSLDLVGTTPRAEEVTAYLARPSREELVDRLLASEEFDAWWARFLLELATERRAILDETHNGRQLYDWLRGEIQKRRPYDQIVREMIQISGHREEVPQVNFILRYNARPSDVTGAVGRAFLGLKLQCAQCHDHPFAPFTQEDFWGMAAFFARTKRYYVEDTDIAGVTDIRRGTMHMPTGDEEEANPEKPKVAVQPRWLGEKQPAETPSREELARRVTSDPLFARNLVNRVWARLMGRGLVEPLDGFGAKGRPSHPELLNELSARFVSSGYDLRAIVRAIVVSKAYQRSGRERRPLSADQVVLSLVRATGWMLDEDGSVGSGETMEKMEAEEDERNYADAYPEALLGASPRSLRRALAMLNHGDVHGMVDSGARFLMKKLGKPVAKEHFDDVYRSLLSRLPTETERRRFAGKFRRSDLEDVLWAVINSIEFRNNH